MLTKQPQALMDPMLVVCIPPWREVAAVEELAILCRDTGIATVAFMAQAQPEMPPLLDKIHAYVERFSRMRDRLHADAVRCGILLQQTIGHGQRYQPLSPLPFQRIVGADGQACPECFCPLDEDFAQYLCEVMTCFTQADPAFLLVDDDFRLQGHAPALRGCACPLHLAGFGERTGRSWTRPELLEAVAQPDDIGRELRWQWQQFSDQTLLQLAARLRAAIDAVDPQVRCGFCSVASQRLMHEQLARTLAGTTRPLLRFNGAFYNEQGFKRFPLKMALLAQQQARLGADIETMSEADTWPQNRHSLSATSLRAYMTGGALLGIDGAKLWITSIVDWRLEEAQPYQAMLADSRWFFAAASAIGKNTVWQGPVALSSGQEIWRAPWSAQAGQVMNWMGWGSLCGRLGIPFCLDGDGVAMLEGNAVDGYSDAELQELLGGAVLLDGIAAQSLTRRGFAPLLGVAAVPDETLRASLEQYVPDEPLNGSSAGRYAWTIHTSADQLCRLSMLDAATRPLSWLQCSPWHNSSVAENVAPALTLYENHLGGRVAVYAHALPAPGDSLNSFTDDIRKQQLCGVLGWLARQPLPLVVADDAEVFVMYGRWQAEHVVAIFNLGTDAMPSVRLSWPHPVPGKLLRLDDDGVWHDQDYTISSSTLSIALAVPTMRPLLLRMSGDRPVGC